jgi:hypothetical protein
MSLELKVEDVIPEYYDHISVASWDDLRFLGKQNITALMRAKQSAVHETQECVDTLRKYAALLNGRSGDDIAVMAKEYVDPKIPRGTFRLTRYFNHLEPTRRKDILREFDTTTFNNCGWCEHRGSGSYRHDYMIDGNCNLLAKADIRKEKSVGVASKGCLLRAMDADEIAALVNGYRTRRKALEERLRYERALVTKMCETADAASDKPFLPDLRPYDHFNIGDRVVGFIGRKKDGDLRYQMTGFLAGTVQDGYRHHDGCVTMKMDVPCHDNTEFFDGRGLSGGSRSPDMMLASEFGYLKKHPDFALEWLSSIEISSASERRDYHLLSKALLGDTAMTSRRRQFPPALPPKPF